MTAITRRSRLHIRRRTLGVLLGLPVLVVGCMSTPQPRHLIMYSGEIKPPEQIAVLYISSKFDIKTVDGDKPGTAFGQMDLLPGEHTIVSSPGQAWSELRPEGDLVTKFTAEAGKRYELVFGIVTRVCEDPVSIFSPWKLALGGAGDELYSLETHKQLNLSTHYSRIPVTPSKCTAIAAELDFGKEPSWWKDVGPRIKRTIQPIASSK